MTLAERLKALRRELGFTQEAVGAQGFISTPGWIKIENGQRAASEKLIDKLVTWLVRDKHIRVGPAQALREELLILKHLGSRSPFVRRLATELAQQTPGGRALLVASAFAKAASPPNSRSRRPAAGRCSWRRRSPNPGAGARRPPERRWPREGATIRGCTADGGRAGDRLLVSVCGGLRCGLDDDCLGDVDAARLGDSRRAPGPDLDGAHRMA